MFAILLSSARLLECVLIHVSIADKHLSYPVKLVSLLEHGALDMLQRSTTEEAQS